MSLTTLTLADLYSEISDLARDQGINSKEQWDELVESVVEDHLDLGELDLEEDSEGIKDDLKAKWGTYKKESAEDSEELALEEEEEGKKVEGDDDLLADDDEQI
jgi:hypothetical protein